MNNPLLSGMRLLEGSSEMANMKRLLAKPLALAVAAVLLIGALAAGWTGFFVALLVSGLLFAALCCGILCGWLFSLVAVERADDERIRTRKGTTGPTILRTSGSHPHSDAEAYRLNSEEAEFLCEFCEMRLRAIAREIELDQTQLGHFTAERSSLETVRQKLLYIVIQQHDARRAN